MRQEQMFYPEPNRKPYRLRQPGPARTPAGTFSNEKAEPAYLCLTTRTLNPRV